MSKIEITTNRLLLRPLSIEDAEAFYNYKSDALANQFQGWVPDTIEEVYDFVQNKIVNECNVVHTWYQLAIIRKNDNVLIGDIGLHFIDHENKQVEIGFTLDKKYQGNGYAMESIEKVLDYLFIDLGKHRVIASVDPGNVKSLKLLEKLGFRKEAHFKKSIFLHGKWVDDVIFAMLKEEWI